MEEGRPTPEAMLERAHREETRSTRGRLKIFFGATPGVGKTYAMLEAARARRTQGADVVAGWAETHGRKETGALLEGLERLPPRAMVHRGVQVLEFDLDAALERAPGLLLVDELAHTNVPGSRHARRWQDVVELLESGIDVWTTLNVQHVESLNDVVAGITGVTVRETVPDSLIDGADEIEVVDLPPDELLQRMREGKVYLPAQAVQAAENFFRKGNLIALRELALRRAAERVEAQAAEYKRDHGIDETWRTQERLMVAFDHAERSSDLIRAGRRMAASLHARWIALTVEDPRHARLPQAARERLAENVALAQRLGAETLVVRGAEVAAQVLSVARERGITRLVVGRPSRSRWLSLLRASRTERIVRGAEGIDVLVTTGETGTASTSRPRGIGRPSEPREYAWAALSVAITTATCWVTRDFFTLADQAMIYLLGVLVASSRLSRVPSLAGAIASIAALDFFFVPPQFTFAVEDLRYVVTFAVMLLVAVAVSRRTVRMREDADEARERERRSASLFAMSRDFGRADDAQGVARIAVDNVRSVLQRDAAIYLRDGPELRLLAGNPTGALSTPRELAVAQFVADQGRPAGRGTDTLPASAALYLPILRTQDALGVLGVSMDEGDPDLSPSQRQLLETFAAQTAVALERVILREEAARARLTAETERTRSTLLSSVSHDLRTPLAAIGGSAQVLLDEERPLSAAARRELLETVREESDRLGRLVGNLLDLTKLDSGATSPAREWVPAEEIVESAVSRVRARIPGRELVVSVPEDVLEVHADPVLLEQALVNLLENAGKYSSAGAPIGVSCVREGDLTVFDVADRGPGIAPKDADHVFERFYRSGDARGIEGSGLGLAVVQAIARAHEGWVRVTPRDGGGSVFRLGIPGARTAAGGNA